MDGQEQYDIPTEHIEELRMELLGGMHKFAHDQFMKRHPEVKKHHDEEGDYRDGQGHMHTDHIECTKQWQFLDSIPKLYREKVRKEHENDEEWKMR